MNKWVIRAIYVVAVLLMVVIGYQYWSVKSAYKLAHKTMAEMSFGPADADVSVVEFLDYRCAACRGAHPEVMKAMAAHPDVRFTFRHWPVFGKPSIIEADMAIVAARHGKFKEMHEILISREDPVAEEEILPIAESLGLNTATFREEMKAGENGALLLSTDTLGRLLRLPSTPSFLINDRIFTPTTGPVTAEDLAKEIAAAKAEK